MAVNLVISIRSIREQRVSGLKHQCVASSTGYRGCCESEVAQRPSLLQTFCGATMAGGPVSSIVKFYPPISMLLIGEQK